MAPEYNSILISKLYQATTQEEMIETLNEINEIGDPVFLHPVLDGFRNYKKRFPFLGHYFIGTLGAIRSKEAGKILEEFLKDNNMDVSLYPWVLSSMNNLGYYAPAANDLAKHYLSNLDDPDFKKEFDVNEFDMAFIFDYLKGAKIINECAGSFKNLLFSGRLNKEEKSKILYYFLRINPKEGIDYLIENYEERIKGTDGEITIAKELIGWKGGKTSILKDLIIKHGHGRAKEILEKEHSETVKTKAKEEEKIHQEESSLYHNARIVEEIAKLRNQINIKFELTLFPDAELFCTQMRTINDKNSLISFSVNLRSIIGKIDNQVKNHGYSEPEINDLLCKIPEEHRGKPFNQFYLYLKSKGISVDFDLFGLRSLNTILNLIGGHPDAEKDLLNGNYDKTMIEMYKKEEWGKIQEFLLNYYKQSLERFNKVLS